VLIPVSLQNLKERETELAAKEFALMAAGEGIDGDETGNQPQRTSKRGGGQRGERKGGFRGV
jgi:hypothetical protein